MSYLSYMKYIIAKELFSQKAFDTLQGCEYTSDKSTSSMTGSSPYKPACVSNWLLAMSIHENQKEY